MRWVLLGVALAGACASRGAVPLPVEPPAVLLRPAGRPEVRVRVELARTHDERMRGLMYREKLDPDVGMLFLFEQEQPLTFWMKNTYIPLDIIFITKDHRVLGVVENAEPLKTTGCCSVPGLSKFVLEVVGGFAAQHGIAAGTPVEFVHVD